MEEAKENCPLERVEMTAALGSGSPTATPATAMGQGAPPNRGQWPQPLRSHPPALERPPQAEDLRPNPHTGT